MPVSVRARALAMAVGLAALAAPAVTPAASDAASRPAVWATRGAVHVRVTHLPPGPKRCWLQVPPAPYDLLGIYVGSQQGTNAERQTSARSVTLTAGGLMPATYRIYFECRKSPSLDLIVATRRTVFVGP
ncbi:hypothetical protein nbrc107697_04470 [Gordonia crocea]|uniref:Uncharacterized protein n=2 Tax=Gordonia crocea TaxID=589162 RepID=A0A7M3SUT4_9ACTN|nr:hypothetical protein nbrc107697_04470 [Gordonia crocea]